MPQQPTYTLADGVNAQMFQALLATNRQLGLLSNDRKHHLFADKYPDMASEVMPATTRALLDSEPGAPRILAAIALVDDLELVAQALEQLRYEARNAAARASAQDIPSTRQLAEQFDQTQSRCETLLAKLAELLPRPAAANDDVENQDTLPLDMAC